MPFQIIFVDHDKYSGNDMARGDAITLASLECADAQEANRYITDHKNWCARNGWAPAKLRIQKVVTAAWEEREAKRLEDGTYTPLPDWFTQNYWWRGSLPARKHYAHLADKAPGKIAFTESPEKGEADIQLVISPTTYLSRFFSHELNQREIRDIGAMFQTGEHQLKTSMRPEDFEDVYERATEVCVDGSSGLSCMRHNREEWDLEHHPAYAYGAGDLAIAWIENEDGVLGRAVIWPEKKTYVRVYGIGANYQALMHTLLKREGYRHTSEFEGARLMRIPVETDEMTYDLYLMPYLDNRSSRYLEDKGDHFVMTTDGNNIYADCTEGVLRVAKMVKCVGTGITIQASQAYIVDGEFWSETHLHRNRSRVNYCDYTSERTMEPVVRMINRYGNVYTVKKSIADTLDTFTCQRTGYLVDKQNGQSIEVHTPEGVQIWSNHDRSTYRISRTDGLRYARGYNPASERQAVTAEAPAQADIVPTSNAGAVPFRIISEDAQRPYVYALQNRRSVYDEVAEIRFMSLEDEF